ncbi:hypothetical protein BCEN4_850018 [Burkholderia cenocepacia]|nr:hypothetical protein BCEN4_850018 [Burkholderia cenocepacia]
MDVAVAFLPKSSITLSGTNISTAMESRSARNSPFVQNISRGSDASDSLAARAASRIDFSLKRDKNLIASNTFDLPTPFKPAIQLKVPNDTEKSIRFLNPFTSSFVNIIIQSQRQPKQSTISPPKNQTISTIVYIFVAVRRRKNVLHHNSKHRYVATGPCGQLHPFRAQRTHVHN